MTRPPSIRIAPGGGRLARRAASLLFLPDASEEGIIASLLASFLDSGDDPALALADAVLDADGAAPSFVFVAWSSTESDDTATTVASADMAAGLHVMVRGDARIRSDLRSLPELTGTGSATWAEHRVHRWSGPAMLEAGADALAHTELREGVVPAGGFVLSLDGGDDIGVSTSSSPAAIATPPDDAEGDARPIEARTSSTPAEPVALTHARLCSERHANPPHTTSCSTCGGTLDHAEVTVEQPVIGRAELPDGRIIDLAATYVIGRRPQRDAAGVGSHAQLITLDVPSSVSRTHLVLRASGWAITVTDCGSQGGSALLTPSDEEPVALLTGVPHEVEGGDVVYLGGPTIVRILDV